jgi:hypothetical protein
MYGSKKQYWILEMIKGADLTPAVQGPGRYATKGRMTIALDEGESLPVGPTDVLDLSSSDQLGIEMIGRRFKVSWDKIVRIDFETVPEPAAPILQTAYMPSKHRLLSFPIDKKAAS